MKIIQSSGAAREIPGPALKSPGARDDAVSSCFGAFPKFRVVPGKIPSQNIPQFLQDSWRIQ
jgi:hypothetical protein